jgi:hypothetical protein
LKIQLTMCCSSMRNGGGHTKNERGGHEPNSCSFTGHPRAWLVQMGVQAQRRYSAVTRTRAAKQAPHMRRLRAASTASCCRRANGDRRRRRVKAGEFGSFFSAGCFIAVQQLGFVPSDAQGADEVGRRPSAVFACTSEDLVRSC